MNSLSARAAKLLGASFVLLAAVRCAHVEPPSGGPVDATPPAVAAVYPAPGATGVPADARVILQFTEWIDRGATRGTAMISPPYAGRTRVEVDGDRLIVKPPAGRIFRPNATHVVTVLGTLKDLRGNGMGRVFELRFSTGATLDSAGFSGRLGMDGRRGPLIAALYHVNNRERVVEQANPRDTAFSIAPAPEPWRELPAFLAGADSLGRFTLDGAVEGEYGLFAFEDVNGNFTFDIGLEAAAVGEPTLALRPRAPEQSLRLVPLDTLPLRVTEVVFVPDSGGTEESPAGALHVTFGRAPHPVRAAEAARYAVLPDSGEPVAVTGAGWHPERGLWILEVPPLRAGMRHRLVTRRPDFAGRQGAEEPDTSAPFDVVPRRDTTAAAWTLTPLVPGGGPTGLPVTASTPAAGTRLSFLSSLPLTTPRWTGLTARLEARVRTTRDTTPRVRTHRLQRVGPGHFAVMWNEPLRPGDALELRLRPVPIPGTDSLPPAHVLYTGTVPDTTRAARLKVPAPADRADAVYWAVSLDGAGAPRLHPLVRAGDNLESAPLPFGRYTVHGFRDLDGDGVWNPGSLRPWIPQEPYEILLDTVTLGN